MCKNLAGLFYHCVERKRREGQTFLSVTLMIFVFVVSLPLSRANAYLQRRSCNRRNKIVFYLLNSFSDFHTMTRIDCPAEVGTISESSRSNVAYDDATYIHTLKTIQAAEWFFFSSAPYRTKFHRFRINYQIIGCVTEAFVNLCI